MPLFLVHDTRTGECYRARSWHDGRCATDQSAIIEAFRSGETITMGTTVVELVTLAQWDAHAPKASASTCE